MASNGLNKYTELTVIFNIIFQTVAKGSKIHVKKLLPSWKTPSKTMVKYLLPTV